MNILPCPACSQPLALQPEHYGIPIQCPSCQQTVTIASPAGITTADQNPQIQDGGPQLNLSIDTSHKLKTTSKTRKRKKSSSWAMPAGLVVGSLAVLAGACYWLFALPNVPTFSVIDDSRADELVEFQTLVTPLQAERWSGQLEYHLVASPDGASIDKNSGLVTWTPTEEQAPGWGDFIVECLVQGNQSRKAAIEFRVHADEVNQAPIVNDAQIFTAIAGQENQVKILASDLDSPPNQFQFQLVESNVRGMEIDAKTGVLTWVPKFENTNNTLNVKIKITELDQGGLSSESNVQFKVLPGTDALGKLVTNIQDQGHQIKATPNSFQPGKLNGKYHSVVLNEEEILFAHFDVSETLKPDVIELRGTSADNYVWPGSWSSSRKYYFYENLLAVYGGNSTEVMAVLKNVLPNDGNAIAMPGKPLAKTMVKPMEIVQEDYGIFNKEEGVSILALAEEEKLFSAESYPVLRKIFSDQFERVNAVDIKLAFSEDYEAMMDWFSENTSIKEELYLAIDPQTDKLVEALKIFRSIKNAYPEKIIIYADLAIATSVVWDNPRAIYSHKGAQGAAKATEEPDSLSTPVDNFKYLVDAENFMQGRIQYAPWEFLVHQVNHTTSLKERQWALQNYGANRTMFGKCYHDVPYDYTLLNSGFEIGKLIDKPYHLPNIRQFGGVCMHQADYAARVGKSIGIPAAYVAGSGKSGGRHAWVMWVELKNITPNSIQFSLESHGRYRGDHYYIGNLTDPKTGTRITDRQLELRLHTVGLNPLAKRQADMLMMSYPLLQEKLKLDIPAQLDFLGDIIANVPGCEAAWEEVARIAGESEVKEKHQKRMVNIIDLMFTCFANYPDFTITIFDNMIAFREKIEDRSALYERLITLYELKKRPDLAAKARLTWVEMMLYEGESEQAIQGLAYTIKKFPDEGTIVPKLLDKLEEICETVEGAEQSLAPFYHSFLPAIPQKRGGRRSEYCIQMYQRGITQFRKHGAFQLAAIYENELKKLYSLKAS